MTFLDGFDEKEIRTGILAGISELHSDQSIFIYGQICHALANQVLPPEIREAATKQWIYKYREPGFPNERTANVEDPDTSKILSVLWRMTHDGIFYPRVAQDTGNDIPVAQFCLSLAGKRQLGKLLESPYAPGFVGAFKQSAAKLDPDVIGCFENAVECFQRGIFRASMMLVGVAAEITARVAYEALVKKGSIAAASRFPQAQETIIRLKAATSGTGHEAKDLHAALSSLDVIRGRRNDAAHPERADFSSAIIEEMLILAAVSIPKVWKLIVEREIANSGFVWPPPP